MRQPAYLDDSNTWSISGISHAEGFFRAIPRLVPEATHVFLEGSPDPDVVALLGAHAVAQEYGAPKGTLWSWPRSHRYALHASPELFSALADLARRHAQPDICSHVHVYRDLEPLVQWFDAFSDPLMVSKAIPRERVEQFCAAVEGTLTDPAA